jgi:RES domain-containing protein
LTVTAWRVVKHRFAESAFDGEGARLFGGRWHSVGRAVVYTSATTSLALLETLVHADLGMLPFYVTIPITIDAALIETLDPARLPPNWRSFPAPFALQQIGDEWVASRRSCVLEVPSVIVPHESNFILNPAHPEIPSIEIGDPLTLETDPRLE